jgi:hypothetical protein
LTDIVDVTVRSICTVPSQIWNEYSDTRPLQRQRERMHIHTATRRSVQQHSNVPSGRSVLAVGQERSVACFVTEQPRQRADINGREWLRNGGGRGRWLRRTRNWAARLRRQEDFYQESALLWLEADTIIRRGTKGRKSLDDFCKLFYGPPSTGPKVVPYDLDDVVHALSSVYAYDWAAFWNERLNRLRAAAPLEGLQAAGWSLALNATPSIMHAAHRSPADAAGASPGSHLVALNGYKWSKELLHDTLAAPPDPSGTITLLIEKDDTFKTLELKYSGGERYPNLVKDAGTEDVLASIARPRTVELKRPIGSLDPQSNEK